jgi:hypothetical protein
MQKLASSCLGILSEALVALRRLPVIQLTSARGTSLSLTPNQRHARHQARATRIYLMRWSISLANVACMTGDSHGFSLGGTLGGTLFSSILSPERGLSLDVRGRSSPHHAVTDCGRGKSGRPTRYTDGVVAVRAEDSPAGRGRDGLRC